MGVDSVGRRLYPDLKLKVVYCASPLCIFTLGHLELVLVHCLEQGPRYFAPFQN